MKNKLVQIPWLKQTKETEDEPAKIGTHPTLLKLYDGSYQAPEGWRLIGVQHFRDEANPFVQLLFEEIAIISE